MKPMKLAPNALFAGAYPEHLDRIIDELNLFIGTGTNVHEYPFSTGGIETYIIETGEDRVGSWLLQIHPPIKDYDKEFSEHAPNSVMRAGLAGALAPHRDLSQPVHYVHEYAVEIIQDDKIKNSAIISRVKTDSMSSGVLYQTDREESARIWHHNIQSGDIHALLALLYVLGDADLHLNNFLIDIQSESIYSIDHEMTFNYKSAQKSQDTDQGDEYEDILEVPFPIKRYDMSLGEDGHNVRERLGIRVRSMLSTILDNIEKIPYGPKEGVHSLNIDKAVLGAKKAVSEVSDRIDAMPVDLAIVSLWKERVPQVPHDEES